MTYTAEQQKANRDKWVAALRSGAYKQTFGTLRDSDGFCCLGVACDLAAREGVVREWDGATYAGDSGGLPLSVQNWLGLSGDVGMLNSVLEYRNEEDTPSEFHSAHSLAEVNDEALWEFPQIAKLIEAGAVRLRVQP